MSRTPSRLATEEFRGRWNEPGVVSFAQNAEDVRLWRIFAHKPRGFYVDVGAADPVLHSVTKLFYDAGWDGINVEPGPLHSQLVEERPRDVNLRVAVATEPGERDFWVSSPDTGISGFELPSKDLIPEGFSFRHTLVPCERLGTLLDQYAQGREIDFLKIDVEGAEADVIASFDVSAVRPTVVVVEAISPLDNWRNHQAWEPMLLDHGYVFAAFDGVNRFYVPVERDDLVDALAYPMSVLDRYQPADAVVQRARDHQALARRADQLERELEAQRQRLRHREAEHVRLQEDDKARGYALVEAMEQSLSWRVTRPLRAIRRAQLRRTRRFGLPDATSRSATRSEYEAAFAGRLVQALGILDPASELGPGIDLDHALGALAATLSGVAGNDLPKAWLSLVTVDGLYPGERAVAHVARRLRMEGASAVVAELLSRFDDALARGGATVVGLDVRYDTVVVDVTNTVSHGYHTGIQRVVRETVGRWVDKGRELDLAHFDPMAGCLQRLAHEEELRLQGWRAHADEIDGPSRPRRPRTRSDDVLVPWRCRLVLPEVAGEARRSSALRALVTASVARSLSLVGYDTIPVVASETLPEGMPATFGHYLSVAKYATRISAISQASAAAFRGFAEMTASSGLPAPRVGVLALPTETPVLAESALAEARLALGFDHRPTIVVVGSHGPHKNHLAVLEASERLWTAAHDFRLLFIGGSSWKSEAFDELVGTLVDRGRPIVVRRSTTEEDLWACYRLARFSVFVSLLEGYGLPVAESLVSGTPAITSSYGSTAEIAQDGGCLLVDPRRVDELASVMGKLLTDDGLLHRLRDEAAARPLRTWEAYADQLWHFLVDPSTT